MISLSTASLAATLFAKSVDPIAPTRVAEDQKREETTDTQKLDKNLVMYLEKAWKKKERWVKRVRITEQ
jgi:hypothetical protein